MLDARSDLLHPHTYKSLFDGFLVSVSSRDEAFTSVAQSGFAAPAGSVTYVAMDAVAVDGQQDGFRGRLTPEERRCYFEDEYELSMFTRFEYIYKVVTNERPPYQHVLMNFQVLPDVLPP